MGEESQYAQIMGELYQMDTDAVMTELTKWCDQLIPERINNYLLRSSLEFEGDMRTTIKFTITAKDFKGAVITHGAVESLLSAKDLYDRDNVGAGLYELAGSQVRMIGCIKELLLCVIQEIIASGESASGEAQAD